MRALLAASLGSLCAAALIVPLAQPAAAQFPTATDLRTHTDPTSATSADATASTTRASARANERPARTRVLPLTSLGERDRALGTVHLGARKVAPFSLLGAVWDHSDDELHDQIEVRTRTTGTGTWTGWRALENHSTDAPDQDSAERAGGKVRGSTAPLWVGDSDAVDVRLRSEADASSERTLPAGLRLSLIDPGGENASPSPATRTQRAGHTDSTADHGVTTDAKPGRPAPELTAAAAASSAVNAQLAGLGAQQIPAQNPPATLAAGQLTQDGADAAAPIGPRPGIVTRAGWGANESWREPGFGYTTTVKSAFVHHTAESNNYTCAQAPSVIRSIYQYHVRSLGWRDIGYNFLVDKCGKIYEGRAGGVAKAVLGAHTYGFNSNTTGIAVLGSFGSTAPPKAAVEGVSKLIAWKLGLHGLNPVGSVTLTSGGGKWPAGTQVKMRAVAGHRDGFATECPGAQLYAKLPEVRTLAARLQGR